MGVEPMNTGLSVIEEALRVGQIRHGNGSPCFDNGCATRRPLLPVASMIRVIASLCVTALVFPNDVSSPYADPTRLLTWIVLEWPAQLYVVKRAERIQLGDGLTVCKYPL